MPVAKADVETAPVIPDAKTKAELTESYVTVIGVAVAVISSPTLTVDEVLRL